MTCSHKSSLQDAELLLSPNGDLEFWCSACLYDHNRLTLLQSIYRSNFDFMAQCGIWVCEECYYVMYPIELEHNEETGEAECNQCLGAVFKVDMSKLREETS